MSASDRTRTAVMLRDRPAPAERPPSRDRPASLAATVPALGANEMVVTDRDAAVDAGELPRGTAVGRYLLLDKVGRGGMGVVYSAYDPALDRRVAVKLLHMGEPGSSRLDRSADLLREAQHMAKLAHPNVLVVYDVGMFGDQVFVAMELVAGVSLRYRLEEKPYDWHAVRDLYVAAGRGLAAAHRAGVVHGDFKPDNVLVSGDDARVLVADFGLAHRFDPARAAAGGDASLTSIGGTPGYMAPEQHAGKPGDALGDQFSFCVALYEGLYGKRLFKGETLAELATTVMAGKLEDAPAGRQVPAWLRRVVLRGLAVDRSARHPSMDALVAELGRDPGAARRRVMIAVAAAVALAGGVTLALARGGDKPCRGAARNLAGVWDDSRRVAVRAGLAATGVPYAGDTADRVVAQLDRYAEQWVVAHESACQATRVHREQSEAVLDERMACLSLSLTQLDTLAEQLVHADTDIAQRAVSAAALLSPLGDCADVAMLHIMAPLPDDAAVRLEFAKISADVKRAEALAAVGRYADAIEVAEAAIPRARAIGARGPLADALMRAGTAYLEVGDLQRAEDTLMKAVLEASATQRDGLAMVAWFELVRAARGLGHYTDAIAWLRQAYAANARAGGVARIKAGLLIEEGSILEDLGFRDEAMVIYRQALALDERTLPVNHPDRATSLHTLANAAYNSGRFDQAEELWTRAVAVRRSFYGDRHPMVAELEMYLGTVAMRRGHLDEALARAEQALALAEPALGPKSARVADFLTAVAQIRDARGEYEEALEYTRRAYENRAAVLSSNTRELNGSLMNLAVAYGRVGRIDEARAAYGKVLETAERIVGPRTPDVGIILINMGELERRAGRHDEAIAHHARSLAILEEVLGPDNPILGHPLTGLGRTHLARGAPREAVPPLERAMAVREAAGEGGPDLAETRFALAQALWVTGGDKARARELAAKSRDAYDEAGPGRDKDRDEVAAWLAAH